jgi:hypothetical protein
MLWVAYGLFDTCAFKYHGLLSIEYEFIVVNVLAM